MGDKVMNRNDFGTGIVTGAAIGILSTLIGIYFYSESSYREGYRTGAHAQKAIIRDTRVYHPTTQPASQPATQPTTQTSQPTTEYSESELERRADEELRKANRDADRR